MDGWMGGQSLRDGVFPDLSLTLSLHSVLGVYIHVGHGNHNYLGCTLALHLISHFSASALLYITFLCLCTALGCAAVLPLATLSVGHSIALPSLIYLPCTAMPGDS